MDVDGLELTDSKLLPRRSSPPVLSATSLPQKLGRCSRSEPAVEPGPAAFLEPPSRDDRLNLLLCRRILRTTLSGLALADSSLRVL
jgi:hypothetical protein